MRVLFLQSLTYPFIGLMSLSAMLKRKGHETRVMILNLNRPTDRDFQEIRDYAPGLIGLPVYTGWQRGILKFCRELKDRTGLPIIFGGPHPTYVPDIIRHEAVDYLCLGEGEVSFPQLVDRLAEGSPVMDLPGIWYKRNGSVIDTGVSPLPDLPDLPPMDIDLYTAEHEAVRTQENREFSLNRGCPFHCSYCSEFALRRLYGKRVVRSKTVDQALEEIQYVMARAPFKSVYFTSDNFCLDKDFAYEFLPRFKKEIGVPFYCQMRVEYIDADLARLLKDSGCHMVGVGLESGSLRVRREILNRPMSDEALIRGCRHLQDQGIMINTYNMIGIPGETFDEALETLELNIKINPTCSEASLFQPYPGTKIAENLIQQGLMSPETFDALPTTFWDKTVILGKDTHLFTNLQRLFQLLVSYPQLAPLARHLCRVNIPRVYDLIFVLSFYRYVRLAYKKGPVAAMAKVLKNALEALKARQG